MKIHYVTSSVSNKPQKDSTNNIILLPIFDSTLLTKHERIRQQRKTVVEKMKYSIDPFSVTKRQRQKSGSRLHRTLLAVAKQYPKEHFRLCHSGRPRYKKPQEFRQTSGCKIRYLATIAENANKTGGNIPSSSDRN